jgi:hypothetical protein
MAINDVVDLNPILNDALAKQPRPLQEIDDSNLFATPQAKADLPYSESGGTYDTAKLKNFLVEKGVPISFIDGLVGAPGGFRDRATSLDTNPSVPGGVGFGPLKIRAVKELFDPTDAGTMAAKEAGVNTEDTPTEISEIASYLPMDQYDDGIRRLVKQHYFSNPEVDKNHNFEFQREPYNKQILYREPISNEMKFINPPGIDFGSAKAGIQPLIYEGIGLLTGIAATMKGGPVVTGTAGAIGGALAAGETADEFGMGRAGKSVATTAGGVAGAIAGTTSGLITIPLMGEIYGSYLFRYNNLNMLKERGLIDYTPEQIQTAAMKDAGMTTLFSLGGAAAYKYFSKFLGNTPGIPGIDEEDFIKAFDDLKLDAIDNPAQTNVLKTASVPEIMAAGDVGSPITRQGFEADIVKEAGKGGKRGAEITAKIDAGRRAKIEGLEEVVETAGPSMPSKTGSMKEEMDELAPEVVLRKEELGKEFREDFKESLDPKVEKIELEIQNERGSFGDQLSLLLDNSVSSEDAVNYLKETLLEIKKKAGGLDKSVKDPYKSFKVQLNDLIKKNKNNDKTLSSILDFSNSGDRDFFIQMLKDPDFPEAKMFLKQTLRNKYKNMLELDDAGNLIPMSPKAHDAFLKANKNSMDDLFGPEELKEFADARVYGRQLDNRVKRKERQINELRKEPWGGNTKPEFIFRETWTSQREGITATRKVREIVGDNSDLSDEYRLLILNDIKQQTGDFSGGKSILKYVDDYGAMMDEWFPKKFKKDLKTYGKLIDDLQVSPGTVKNPALLVELINKAARVYVGFFTAPGRALSATKQLLQVYNDKAWVDILLDPEQLATDIGRRKLLNSKTARAIARAGGREAGREEAPTEGNIPVVNEGVTEKRNSISEEDYNSIFNMEDLKLNRGGSPLIELKYNY